MKIGLVGGGTGGHFYPLLAVAAELNKATNKPELYYFGPSPYNKEQLGVYGITYVYCPAGKLRLYASFQNFLDMFRNFFGMFVAIWKLFVIYPDVIFSKGGYTAVPILLAARFLRIPIVFHESDAVPGRANKLATGAARYIAISYDDAAQFFPPEKTALTGIPIRPELLNPPSDPFTYLGIPNDKPLIYITGGSLGAERINNLVLRLLDELLPHYRVFHQTGPTNFEETQLAAQALLKDTNLEDSYYLHGNIDATTVAALLSASTLIITRAGSTTLFEIAAYQKPSIVIPLPEDISRDQRSNAYAYARGGGATIIEEHNLTEHLLSQEIFSIVGNPTKAAEMGQAAAAFYQPDAAQKLASVLISIGLEHGS
ncbi:glycosyltransferase [Candidatus Kaiserbacteria bacterium]|nr:glycosyltransferase [Candidatus Kaiserbacteria bacterium]